MLFFDNLIVQEGDIFIHDNVEYFITKITSNEKIFCNKVLFHPIMTVYYTQNEWVKGFNNVLWVYNQAKM